MTDEIKAKHQLVIDMFSEGRKKEEIEKATGYRRPYINRILMNAGLSTKRCINDFSDTVRRMHKEGKAVREIANEIGFTECNIRVWLTKNGLYEPKYKHRIKDNDEDPKMENAVMAKKKPMVIPYEYKGKKYMDITAMYAGG